MSTKPCLHLLGIPHVVPEQDYAHYGFVEQIEQFPRMLAPLGYSSLYYGVERDYNTTTPMVPVISADFAHQHKADCVNVDSVLWKEFNASTRTHLRQRWVPGDLILCSFGCAHQPAIHGFHSDAAVVEPLVGYQHTFARFKVFPSSAWMHWHYGNNQANGNDYWWVINHAQDPGEFPVATEPGEHVLYLGRLTPLKGLAVVLEIAKARPDLIFALAGQGDPKPWLELPNVHYAGAPNKKDKVALYQKAIAVLCPTRYIEPWNSVASESQMCGRPVLCSAFGGLTENVVHGFSGYHCQTLSDWLNALRIVEGSTKESFAAIAQFARQRFAFDVIGPKYDRAFMAIADLNQDGWLTVSKA